MLGILLAERRRCGARRGQGQVRAEAFMPLPLRPSLALAVVLFHGSTTLQICHTKALNSERRRGKPCSRRRQA